MSVQYMFAVKTVVIRIHTSAEINMVLENGGLRRTENRNKITQPHQCDYNTRIKG